MNIKPDDLVLEVGSGDKPSPRSDVLLDKLVEDSSEREAGRRLVIDRLFVVGDVEALPFADKSFDYIIASHVLEHAHNPAKFLSELSRVGKRGYIETPLPLRERVFDWSFHRWYVYQKKGRLVLVKKTAKSKRFFTGIRAEKMVNLYHFEGKKLLNLSFEWQGRITYRILESEPKVFLENLDKKLAGLLNEKEVDLGYWFLKIKAKTDLIPGVAKFNWFSKSWLFKAKKMAKDFFVQQERKKVDLYSLVVCPVCRKRLIPEPKRIRCSSCGRKYSYYHDKIPILLLGR